MRYTFLILAVLIMTAPAHGVVLKGKALIHQRFPAILKLDNGNPVKGMVRFGGGKKAKFRAHDGTEVDIRVRAICAPSPESKIDDCWPNLQVEMDDLSSRIGVLKVSGK
jgi:hypothetical protein